MVDDNMENNKEKNEKVEEKQKLLETEESESEEKNNKTELETQNNKEKNKKTKSKKEKKATKNIFSTPETITLVIIALLIGLTIGRLLNKPNIITSLSISNNEYLTEFIENYEYILDNYYEEIDEEELINSAISGMMESLDDPYSVYMDPEASNTFSITLEGSYKGIGIQIYKDSKTGYMFVSAVFENSPASEAGIKAGDLIISIDKTNAADLTASEFSNIVMESEKDSFILEVLRDSERLELTLNKKVVTLESVVSRVYDEDDKKIGYIYIGIFANNTYEQFKTELEKLESQNIDSLIIDVRSNTGGHLTAVDGILDLFLNSKQIMYQFEQNDKVTSVYGKGKENKNYEIVLLGDSVSASASEVLIAGLRDNLGATFIGEKTYGKGTVQELVTLSDGTQYKITVKKWLTPNGNWINDTEGITPDIEIELDNKYYETGEDEDDSQLQKALEYLKEQN